MSLVNRLDEYFEGKDKKEIIITYLMVFLVIGFLIIYFILPKAQQYKEDQEKIFKSYKMQITNVKNENTILSTRIMALKKRLKSLILEKTALKKQKDFYDELANLLDFTEFNKYKWGEFVNNLVIDAKNDGLTVLGFENKIFEKGKGLINKKMEITINVEGEFKNVVDFIYKYEDIKDLLRVEGIDVDKDKNYKIKFTLYGYEQ